MSESTIQRRPTLTGESGFGFDDDGQRVPLVLPEGEESETVGADEGRIRLEVFVNLLNHLLRSPNAETLNRTVQVLGFKLRLADAAHSVPDLADRLGVSRRMAYHIIDSVTQQDPLFAGVLAAKKPEA